jgi:hypothetical protein
MVEALGRHACRTAKSCVRTARRRLVAFLRGRSIIIYRSGSIPQLWRAEPGFLKKEKFQRKGVFILLKDKKIKSRTEWL